MPKTNQPNNQQQHNDPNKKSDPFLQMASSVPKLIIDNKLEVLVFFIIKAFITAFSSFSANFIEKNIPAMDPNLNMLKIAQQLSIMMLDLNLQFFLFLFVANRLYAYQTKTTTSLWKMFKESFMPLSIEYIRVTASVLLWLLALIIPGLVRQIQLSFVPHVVLFDPDYKTKKTDALRASTQLAHPILGLLIFVTFFELFMQIGLHSTAYKNPLSFEFYAALLVAFLISLYTQSFVYFLYWNRKAQLDESSIQSS